MYLVDERIRDAQTKPGVWYNQYHPNLALAATYLQPKPIELSWVVMVGGFSAAGTCLFGLLVGWIAGNYALGLTAAISAAAPIGLVAFLWLYARYSYRPHWAKCIFASALEGAHHALSPNSFMYEQLDSEIRKTVLPDGTDLQAIDRTYPLALAAVITQYLRRGAPYLEWLEDSDPKNRLNGKTMIHGLAEQAAAAIATFLDIGALTSDADE